MGEEERVGSIHHLALRVSDVERALRFYVGVLGLREQSRFDAPDGSLRSAWVGADPVVIMLERDLRGPTSEMGSGHLLAFAVTDLAGWEARLAAAGVPVEDRTEHTIYCRDPDGHRVGLSAFRFTAAPSLSTSAKSL